MQTPWEIEREVNDTLRAELALAHEQLAHFTKECEACGETGVCKPGLEGDYDDTWIGWYCLDEAGCAARCEEIKIRQVAERKAKREARAAEKAGA